MMTKVDFSSVANALLSQLNHQVMETKEMGSFWPVHDLPSRTTFPNQTLIFDITELPSTDFLFFLQLLSIFAFVFV